MPIISGKYEQNWKVYELGMHLTWQVLFCYDEMKTDHTNLTGIENHLDAAGRLVRGYAENDAETPAPREAPGALNQTEIENYLELLGKRQNLTAKGKEYVLRVRISPPSRNVTGGKNNRSGRVSSRKMGGAIQYESATVELPYTILWERDPNILEFWDQPERIRISYTKPDGKKQTHWITVDYLVLEVGKCGWVECKSEQELLRMEKEKPYLFKRSEDGVWHFLPGEAAAAAYGLFFRVASSSALNPVLVSNIDYLDDYFKLKPPTVPDAIAREVVSVVQGKPGLKLTELIEKCPNAKADHIHGLIANNSIFVDLEIMRLADQKKNVRVFLTDSQARAFCYLDQAKVPVDQGHFQVYIKTELQWNDRKLIVENLTESEVHFRADDGDVKMQKTTLNRYLDSGEIKILTPPPAPDDLNAYRKLAQYTPEETITAEFRYRCLNGQVPAWQMPCDRQMRRFKARFREAQANRELGYCGFLGLFDRYENCGDRSPRIAPVIRNLLKRAFDNLYTSNNAISAPAFRAKVVDMAAVEHVEAPSKRFIEQWLKTNHDYAVEVLRSGKRHAYVRKPPIESVDGFQANAMRPWERVHIDHTQCDIELRLTDDRAAADTERPWLSIMVDDYSRKLLAFVILYDEPSYRSCMLLMRECVKREGHLPGTIVVDNGREFKGSYFQPLLTELEIRVEYRPKANPKYGNAVERWFGTANRLFFHQLKGNTKLMQCPREVTKSMLPSTLSVWNLESLSDHFCEFAYEVYNKQLIHSRLGCTPDSKCKLGIELHGERKGKDVYYTEDFRILTMPTTRAGYATIGSEGVKAFTAYWYYTSEMAAHMHEKVPIRYDPYDIRQVYVRIDGKWLWASCFALKNLNGMTERQLKIVSQELHQQQRAHGQKVETNERTLGAFYATADEIETVRGQKLRDAELQKVLSRKKVSENHQSQPKHAPQRSTNELFTKARMTAPRKLKTYKIINHNPLDNSKSKPKHGN